MHKFKYIFILILASCNADFNAEDSKPLGNSNVEYFQSQIDTLVQEKYGLLRHVTTGEEVEQYQNDTMSRELWEEELHGFLSLMVEPNEKDTQFIFSSDTSGIYEIKHITSKDSLNELLEISETKVNEKTELKTWKIQKRSILMDRKMEMTYQPLKGYRIKMYEDPAWSGPKTYEIFAEFIK